MGLAASVAWLLLAIAAQDPAPAPSAPEAAVTVPPALPARPPAEPPAAETPKPASAVAIPVESPGSKNRPLEALTKPEPGPGVGGFVVGSLAVVGALGGAFLILRRFSKGSRFLSGGGVIQVLARKPLAPKQDVFLVEVGPRVFLIGSTKDGLSTLGEFSAPDEVAALRAGLPDGRGDSHRSEFHQSLREGLRDEEKPRDERMFASIADELAEIRKTVRAWRA